ncbi:54S ribosomal protein L8, mitochondrial [Marasmius crinis-equi]|uniref:54S ribosomal protein L8, mitochondrial n=1 Tax=Marasmius crinis-equi TaxID=585013 RepID=A0ABR3FUC4_9AGAR
MKHGVAFRKLSRPTAHRMLMLRNLVTSLFEHEQIQTTLPKARETARLAEKIITLGKKGDHAAQTKASSFLLNANLLPKLFGTFAKRYAERPGGYTRIHKFGNRPGDNAPNAILELVDNPRDLRFEMTSRAIGWELLKDKLRKEDPTSIVQTGVYDAHDLIKSERKVEFGKEGGQLRPKTRWNLQKVLRFRDRSAPDQMSRKVGNYVDHLLANPVAAQKLSDQWKANEQESLATPFRQKAGHILPGDTRSALHLAQGAIGEQRSAPKSILSSEYLFGKKKQTYFR